MGAVTHICALSPSTVPHTRVVRDGWNLDGDGAYGCLWPGEWEDAPSSFAPENYDCDDLDPEVQTCR